MTLQERLNDAEGAYHALMSGRAVRVVVDQNGERIEYVAANAGRLFAYIESLKSQLGLLVSSGPMRFWGR